MPGGMDVVQQELARLETAQDAAEPRPVERSTPFLQGSLEAAEHTFAVAVLLKFADDPGTGVAEALVVDVHGVLGRQHHAEAKRACLLHQGEQGHLGWWVERVRWEVPEHLVEVQEGTQRIRPLLETHPGKNLLEQERHEEHALHVRQMCNGKNAATRPAVRCVKEPLDIQRSAVQPGLERGGSNEAVDAHGKLQPFPWRKEGVHLEDAKLLERRVLQLHDEVREGQVHALAPRIVDDGADKDVLTAANWVSVDAHETKEGRGDTLDLLLRLLVAQVPRRPAQTLTKPDPSATSLPFREPPAPPSALFAQLQPDPPTAGTPRHSSPEMSGGGCRGLLWGRLR